MKRIRNGAEFTKARERLGLTKVDVATLMYLPDPAHGGARTVARWENGEVKAPGPAKAAMEYVLAGHRPAWWKGK